MSSYKTHPVEIVTAFNTLMQDAGRIEAEHGFGKQSFAEDVALIHSEASEALEEFRAGHEPKETYYSKLESIPHKPEGVPSELADIVIRILGVCYRHGVDLGNAILTKMAYNESRPHKHGGKVLWARAPPSSAPSAACSSSPAMTSYAYST